MLSNYIDMLMKKAIYTTDENGVIFAKVPWYQWFFSQGDNVEEARENLKDAIESVIMYKLLNKNDEALMKEIKVFTHVNEVAYA